MSLELKVADKEKDAEVWRDALSGDAGFKFNQPGYELSTGERFRVTFGTSSLDYWNNYWRAPRAQHYLLDYSRNLHHNPNSLMSSLNTAVQFHDALGKKYKPHVQEWIDALCGLVQENILMFETNRIDLTGKSGSFPNNDLYNAFKELKAKLVGLNGAEYGTPQFKQKLEDALKFYQSVIDGFKSLG